MGWTERRRLGCATACAFKKWPDRRLLHLCELSHGTHTLYRAIAQHGPRLALVLWPGVQYRTGQAFDLKEIARLAHAQGAICGFDLAHGAGNLDFQEFLAVYESITLALASHLRELATIHEAR